MKFQPDRRALRFFISIAAVFLLFASFADSLRAQTRPTMSDRDRDLLARETQLREIEKPLRPLPVLEQRMLLRQINKDFERIQLVGREMMKAVAEEGALDVKKILRETDEIKTLAARLKTNLLLPESGAVEPDIETRVGQEHNQVKAALINLHKKVSGFVHNPVFQSSSNVVDARLSAQARRDLEIIIELCRNIKKSAERLGHDSGKSL